MAHKRRDAEQQRAMLVAVAFILAALTMAGSTAGEVYEDCEQPPEIAHGSARLTVDDNEEYVTAHYTCKQGYRLQELQLAQIRCSIETDEWDASKLPACVEDDAHGQEAAEAGKAGANGRRKPGQKGQNIQEDTDVEPELAARLDLSCMAHGLIRAPEIDNGYVVKYNRRKRNGNIFLVAYYECDDYYELQPPEHDRLYCSGRKWIGKRPECASTRTGTEDDEEGDEEEEEEEEEEEDYEEESEDGSEQPSDRDGKVHELPVSSTTTESTTSTAPATTPSTTTESTTTSTTIATTTTSTEQGTTQEPEQILHTITEKANVPDNLSVAEPEPDTDQHRSSGGGVEREETEEDDEDDGDEGDDEDDNGEPENDHEDGHSESSPISSSTPSTTTTTTTTTTKATTVVASCGSDRGGCDHECHLTYHDNAVEPVVECSCYRGFLLDVRDGRTCHDIDECATGNGGCEQTCINKPGSYDCACEAGLQIDTLNGHTCIDINECLLRNGHGPCQDTCENRWGGYVCGCAGLPGTRLATDGHSCEDDGECGRQNGGCSHRCLSTVGRLFCLCPDGLRLGTDWRTCEDIDECQQEATAERCVYGCKNVYGSYRCLEAPHSEQEQDTGEASSQEDDEEDGTGDDAEDEEGHHRTDETDDKSTGESELPDALPDGSDVGGITHPVHPHRHHHGEGHSVGAEVTNRPADDDRDDEALESQEQPDEDDEDVEPDVRERQETGVDVPSEETDKDDDREGGDDEEEEEGEEEEDEKSDANGERPHPEPSRPVAVSCGEGLRLNPVTGGCEDINECEELDHGCDYCENAYGGYQCTCPDGFELAEDDRRCVDVDECQQGADADSEDAETEQEGAACSHECHNTIGSFECRCPDAFHLNNDRRTCVRDYCQDLYENPNKTRCSHDCTDEVEGFRCLCPAGHQLDPVDQKTCHPRQTPAPPADCDDGQRKRCDPGHCHRLDGSSSGYRCECPEGYVQSDHSCHDRDECELGRHDCSHECHNEPGSYRCSCPVGLTLSSDGKTCDDVDECARETNELDGPCGDLECRNTYGSYKCVCAEGRELDEYGICRQMDLCRRDNGGCSHICTFYNRETYCDCPDDLELAEDGRTCVSSAPVDCPSGMMPSVDGRSCEDVDECRSSNGGCTQSCVNFERGFRCACFEGYELEADERTCVDRDECSSAHGGGCDHNCHNAPGSYYCTCHAGYALAENARTCRDVNECEVQNGGCSHVCINLLGGHQCSCPKGQFLSEDDRTCAFVDECELNNGGCSHTCHYEHGVVSCSCPAGYRTDSEHHKTCVDVDECARGNGGCSHECSNSPGSFECLCPEGYELLHDRATCVDVDECIIANGNCSNICINTPGGHRCACEIGYELETELSGDARTCQDVDECEAGTHDCSHRCVNVPGAYECACPEGFQLGRNRLSCEDVDECVELPDQAGCEHRCVNSVGSYRCECDAGHRLAADNQTCEDVDECLNVDDGSRRCTHGCINTKGGFECSCPSGLRLDLDEVTCVDIDECRINSFNGGCSHECVNTDGSFQCRCPDGMLMSDDQATCVDVDECAVLNGGCSQLCVNQEGSYRCGCHPGYSLMTDGRACEVANACALRNGGCQHYCSLKAGRPICSCREGYTLNRTDQASCVDHDECLQTRDHNCQQRCVNLEGSYRCECYTGYERNGLGQCIDVNECLVGNGGCGSTAQCINTAGGSRCACPVGFKLGPERRNCVELRDNCKPFEPPRNADVRCTRSRHKAQAFYRSKCIVTCRKGFKLHGPSVRHCNGTGEWDEGESICVPLACPRLARPEHGVILPVACTAGKIFANERCVLHCRPGFKPAAKRTAVCNLTQAWIPSDNLRCVPSGSAVVSAQPTTVAPVVKPYIKCPPDVHEVLPLGQYTAKVRLERPVTNVDWHQHVDSHPPWGKLLEVELPAGETVVTFRARSPTTNVNDVCRVVIKIRERKPPTVVHCPDSFDVQLERHEPSRSIFWTEPKFESESEIKQLYKSNTPGQPLAAGQHYINYIATDADGLSANCNFRVVVKAAPVEPLEPRRPPAELSRLENHESYLICPGKPPVRLDGSSSYPRHRQQQHQQQRQRESHFEYHSHHQLLHYQHQQQHQQQQQQKQQHRQHTHHHRDWFERQHPPVGPFRHIQSPLSPWQRDRESFHEPTESSAQRFNQISPPPLHVPQGCVVKNIRIKQKLARLRHQQRMLAQHLQHLEESPNASPALIRQQHQRYNNLLRYYSSWDKVSTTSSGGSRSPMEHTTMPTRPPPFLMRPSGEMGVSPPAHHHQQQHPRRWLRKRSRVHPEGGKSGGKPEGEGSQAD